MHQNADPLQARRRRRFKAWFRILAVLFPVLLVLLVEVALRIAGVGFPPTFFIRHPRLPDHVRVENDQVTRTYFPPALVRTPQPTAIQHPKPPGLTRIFLFGESAAMGDPDPGFGMARILEVLLAAALPDQPVEVVSTAITAINSHAILPLAREAMAYQPDLWVIYMGNNEVVGPYGAGTLFGPQTPPLQVIRASLAFQRSRTGQLVKSLRSTAAQPQEWAGMEMFLDQRVPVWDEQLGRVYSHYQDNLQEMLSLAASEEIPVLLSTVAVNLTDSPPFSSMHPPGFSDEDNARWEQAYQAGLASQARGDWQNALEHYQRAAAIDDQFAELRYRLGLAWAHLARTNRAWPHFVAARDLDTLRFRADSTINRIVRESAAASEPGRVLLLDAAELLQAASDPAGLTGSAQEPLFFEHVHLTFRGNYLVARAMADSILRHLSKGSGAADFLSIEDVRDRLALTPWEEYQHWNEMRLRLQDKPFTMQAGHGQRMARVEDRAKSLWSASQEPGSLEQMGGLYREALARRPEDWVLHQNYADFLSAHSDPELAIQQWKQVIALMPHLAETYYSVGAKYEAINELVQAEEWFHKALQVEPNLPEAYNGLGLVASARGQTEEAVANYRQALRLRPGFTQARINLGVALNKLGRVEEATEELNRALAKGGDHAPALLNLGRLRAGQERFEEAIDYYQKAIAIDPFNPIAFYNLGNALLALGRHQAATQAYRSAVDLAPDFPAAHYNLGIELGRAGRLAESSSHFQKVLELEPENVKARFNLGVNLAREQRYVEAIAAFEAVLEKQPEHSEARRFLERAKSLQ